MTLKMWMMIPSPISASSCGCSGHVEAPTQAEAAGAGGRARVGGGHAQGGAGEAAGQEVGLVSGGQRYTIDTVDQDSGVLPDTVEDAGQKGPR